MRIENFEDGEHFFWFAKENRVNCPEIGYLARKIAKSYETNTGKSPKYIEHIVCNCYMAWVYHQSVAYFSKNEQWTEYNSQIKDRKDKFSVISFRTELRYLEAKSYITTLKGRKCEWNKSLSMASRMVPSESLESEFDIAWETAIEYTSETIRFKKNRDDNSKTLRECAKDTTIPAPTAEVLERQDFLTKYNNYLRKQYCTYEGIIKQYLWDKDSKSTVILEKDGDVRFIPQLTSNYSGDWEHGGRFYAHGMFDMVDYQQLSKEKRSTIKINGENTAEVDYSCLHLSLMYAKCGKQLKGDAYGWHTDRKIAKLVTIITLNNTCYYNAVYAVQKALEGTDAVWLASKLIDKMLSYHKAVSQHIFGSFRQVNALTLQHTDSVIMEKVLKSLYKRNIPALPVHDSVIVPAKYRNTAIRIMKEQYKQVTGFEIEVK